MVAATARQRWLVGMENQIIELGVDGFFVVWKKPKETSSAFWFGFKLACYHWTWKSLTVRAGLPWTMANWLPLPKPAVAPSAL
jgi:hypothetical protein